jgi:enoyl-CoA hydratase/carnithine racemase
MIDISDAGRVRTITFQRPHAKNAMNAEMWDATTEAFLHAADDPSVAVVLLTGSEDSFSAGQDLREMGELAMGNAVPATHGFAGLCTTLIDFPKPLVLAVNGLAVGFGTTVLGLADLVFVSERARFKCPFTSLGVAPELASSSTLPTLMGRQNASWLLMSSEWLTAEDALAMGLAFRVCAHDDLLGEARAAAQLLASRPISSLVETKDAVMGPRRLELHAAHQRENEAFARLMGGPANIEAMMAFAEKREANFDGID